MVMEMDDGNFEPKAPEEARRCYGNQIGCIIRTTATINDEKLKKVENQRELVPEVVTRQGGAVGFRNNFKKIPTHTQDHVMHSNERGECCLRTQRRPTAEALTILSPSLLCIT